MQKHFLEQLDLPGEKLYLLEQGSSNRRNNIFQEAIEIGVLRTRVASLIT